MSSRLVLILGSIETRLELLLGVRELVIYFNIVNKLS